MTTIRTKWHYILPLLDAGEFYFTAPPGGKATHWEDVVGLDRNSPREFLDYISKHVPKMVLDPELSRLVNRVECAKSLLDMKKAGVLRLPYPTMVVEIPFLDWSQSHICILRDIHDMTPMPWENEDFISHELTKKWDFYGIVMTINRDEDGLYLVLAPSLLYMRVEERDGEPWLGISCEGLSFIPNTMQVNKIVESTYKKDAAVMFQGIFGAALLMRSFGISQEVIECERLNKKRELSNKEPIPKHTYVRIGRIYKSESGDTSEEYVARRSPRPHWRRGHLRNVHYGAKREKLKQVFVHGRIVALRAGDLEPDKPPEYHVSR